MYHLDHVHLKRNLLHLDVVVFSPVLSIPFQKDFEGVYGPLSK